MDPFIVVVGLLLLTFGTLAALAWWYLAKRAAPYRDEQPSGGNTSARAKHGEEVIILPPHTGAKAEGQPKDRSP